MRGRQKVESDIDKDVATDQSENNTPLATICMGLVPEVWHLYIVDNSSLWSHDSCDAQNTIIYEVV